MLSLPKHHLTAAPTVLILASGRGERFLASGGATHKLDALLSAGYGLPDKTVLQTTVDAVIVTGLPHHIERQNHAGMGDAIAAAVAATRGAHGWLILPADMPLMDSNAVTAVACALQSAENDAQKSIIVPMVNGQRGHPVGFPKACRAGLLGLSGDTGAQSLFQLFKTKKIHVDEIPSVVYPEGCLIDMDTVADLAQVRQIILQRRP